MERLPDLDDRVIALRDSTSALEGFLRESDLKKPDAPPTAPSPPITLADVKARGIQSEWDEAVAIGQALCQVFLVAQVARRIVAAAEDFGDRPTFGLEDVSIDATGRLSIGQNCPRTVPAAIESVGKILSRILPSKDPLALKARIVSKATSVPPMFTSVEEMSRALEGYERRNWTELIKGLYNRAQARDTAAPTAARVSETPTVDPVPIPAAVAVKPNPARSPASPPETKRLSVPPYVLYGVAAL